MIKIRISQLQNSEQVSVGKIFYSIEPADNLTWLFRKADSKIIIRRHVDKNELKEFASSYCSTHNAQLYIKDASGKIAEIIDF